MLRYLTILMAALASAYGQVPVKVILMAGQSNMVGYSDATNVPAPLKTQANVLYYDGSPQTLTTPSPVLGELKVSYNRNVAGYFGPEIAFGHKMATDHPGTQYALVKYAFGGSYLASDPNSWDISLSNNQYANFKLTVSNALSALTSAGYAPEISGMLWLQGESDAFNQAMANAYEANLTALIRDVRGLYGVNLPFVIGGIGDTVGGMNYRSSVLGAQANIANTLPHVAFFNNDDINTERELHFTGDDMMVIGERFAGAYESIPEPTTWGLLGFCGVLQFVCRRAWPARPPTHPKITT